MRHASGRIAHVTRPRAALPRSIVASSPSLVRKTQLPGPVRRRHGLNEVGLTEEFRHVTAQWPVIDLLRLALLQDPSFMKDEDLVAERHGLVLVVGDEDHCRTEFALQRLQLLAHCDAELGVQVAERLIQ